VRFALIGSGVIAKTHARTIGQLGEAAELVVVVTSGRGDGEALARSSGAELSRSTAEVLRRSDVDAVVIYTPTGLHADTAVAALEAGKHDLVEKPLDVTVDAARRVLDAQQRSGRAAAVVSQRRFAAASRTVQEALQAGRLGRLTSCVVSMPWWRDQSYYDGATWRGSRELDGGGALLNQGIHAIDLMTWFMGVPEEVFAWTGCLAHERIDVEDTAVASVRFATGALGAVHATTAAASELAVRLQVHGDRGTAVMEDDRLVLLATAEAGDVSSPRGVGGCGPSGQEQVFLLQYQDFLDSVRYGRPPMVDARAGAQSLAVVEATYRSASTGAPVGVERL